MKQNAPAGPYDANNTPGNPPTVDAACDADVSPGRSSGRMASLEGLTVVDLSRVLTGPFAAMLLGDLGARVIKVERPEVGDETRQWGPPFLGSGDNAVSTYFLSVNRNKESLGLDFREARDLERLKKLFATADIVVENFRPGVLDRLGIGHSVIQAINPRAVILSISGFGPDGEMNSRAGYDQIVQGEAGLMSVTGSAQSGPMKMGIPVADLSAALFGIVGVLAALEERHRTGRGRVVFTSLLSASVGLHTFQGARWLAGGEIPKPEGNLHPTVCPYGAYECADGRLVQIAIGNDSLWSRLANELGMDPEDPERRTNALRRQHRSALEVELRHRFLERSREEWIERLNEVGIPCGGVREMDEVYASEEVLAQNLVLDLEHPRFGQIQVPGSAIRYSDTAVSPHTAPPDLDQHGDELRAWLDAM